MSRHRPNLVLLALTTSAIILLSGCDNENRLTGSPVNITGFFSSLQAPSGSLAAEAILSGIHDQRFTHPPRSGGIGEHGITYWYHGTIPSNLIVGSPRAIEVTYPIFDLVDVWIRDKSGNVRHYQAGTLRPFNLRPIPDPDFAFPLPTDAGDVEIVIAIETTSPLPFYLRLWSMDAWHHHQSGASLWYGIFFGGIGILMAYNLFLAIALRDASYYYYVAYLCALAMLTAMNSGYSEEFLWPDHGGITTRFVLFVASTAIFFVLQFCNHFLGVKTSFPRAYRMSIVIMVTVLLSSLSEVLGFASGAIVVIVVALSDLTLLYYTLISIASYRAGIKQARYILVAFSMYIIGYVYYQTYLFGITEPHWFGVHSIEVGLLLEAIMLSMALADRINVISQKKELAEESMLKAQRDFSRRIIKVQEADRESFANTLHDSIGHGLLVLKQGLEEVLSKPVSDPVGREKMQDLANYCSDVLSDVRGLSHELHPHILTRLGFKAAIEAILERALTSRGIEWVADIESMENILDSDSQLAILRCIQEAINNILKHSNASEVIVSLHVQDHHVSIDIKDDGVGFDVESSLSRGIGLSTMKGRTELLDGSLRIDSRPGVGTRITIRIPFKPA